MKTFTAQVRKGRLVVQEPCDLPEGTVVRVSIERAPARARTAKPRKEVLAAETDGMDPKERAALLESIDRSLAEDRAGKSRPVRGLLAKLEKRARRA